MYEIIFFFNISYQLDLNACDNQVGPHIN